MGSGASTEQKKEKKKKKSRSKSGEDVGPPPPVFGEPEFVSKMALQSKLSILEIETLVRRFKELGCTDDGVVKIGSFEKHSGLAKKEDHLLFKRFVNVLPVNTVSGKKKGKDRLIDFSSFLRVVRFWKLASNEQRLLRLFDLFDLDDNGLIDVYDLRLLLADTKDKYPDAILDISSAAETLYKSMGGKENKGVSPDAFCEWAVDIPEEELNAMFRFDIVDPDHVDLETFGILNPDEGGGGAAAAAAGVGNGNNNSNSGGNTASGGGGVAGVNGHLLGASVEDYAASPASVASSLMNADEVVLDLGSVGPPTLDLALDSPIPSLDGSGGGGGNDNGDGEAGASKSAQSRSK